MAALVQRALICEHRLAERTRELSPLSRLSAVLRELLISRALLFIRALQFSRALLFCGALGTLILKPFLAPFLASAVRRLAERRDRRARRARVQLRYELRACCTQRADGRRRPMLEIGSADHRVDVCHLEEGVGLGQGG